MKTYSPYTLVTAFFDIGRSNWNATYPRAIGEYFNNAARLFTLHDDIIIYIDERYENEVKQIRKNLMDKTLIVPMKIEELPYYKYYNDIKNIMYDSDFNKDLVCPNDPQFKIPLYDIIMWSKTHFLKKAIETNPFHTRHFCWIDFGIHNHMLKNEMLDQKLFPRGVYNKIKFLCRSNPEKEDTDIRSFYKKHIIRLVGSMFSGRDNYITKFHNYMDVEVKLCIENKVVACDQCLFTQIYLKYKDMFSLHYGDWGDVINSYYI